MAKLTTKTRNALPDEDFAVPGKRAYPVNDPNHARAALSRVSANGTPEEKEMVQRKVSSKFPSIGSSGKLDKRLLGGAGKSFKKRLNKPSKRKVL
jgi:hypothetical protein